MIEIEQVILGLYGVVGWEKVQIVGCEKEKDGKTIYVFVISFCDAKEFPPQDLWDGWNAMINNNIAKLLKVIAQPPRWKSRLA